MIDPELAGMIDLLPKMDLLDPVAARQAFEDILVAIKIEIPGIETLYIEDRMVPGFEGDPDVSVRVYRPKRRRRRTRRPGVVMIHGGGFVIGSVETEHGGAAAMAIDSGAVVVSVDYRLAPEHPYPAGLHDCYAALTYLHAEADALGVDPARVALAGASAGGGLAAATALLARDRGGPPRLPAAADPRARRPAPDGFHADVRGLAPLEPSAGRAELAGLSRPALRPADVPAYAAPARAADLSGLPRPTSRRPRTTRCETKGSPTPCACCKRASRSNCTVPRHLPRFGAGDVGRRLEALPARVGLGPAPGPRRRRRLSPGRTGRSFLYAGSWFAHRVRAEEPEGNTPTMADVLSEKAKVSSSPGPRRPPWRR